jgi:hypothetical protein
VVRELELWTHPQLSEFIPSLDHKRDSYLKGVGDPFSETFDPVSDLSQMRRVEERDEGFDRMVSKIEAKMRVFDWGQRVCNGDRGLIQFECFFRRGSPVMRSFITAYNEVRGLGRYCHYDEESEFGVQHDIMLEREWMRCSRQREESLDDSGEGWDEDTDSEIIRKERKEGWRKLMWEEWSKSDRPMTKGYMTLRYVRMIMIDLLSNYMHERSVL